MLILKFFTLAAFILCTRSDDEPKVVKIGAIFFDTEMHLSEAFEAALTEVNAVNKDLQLESIKHHLTLDDSIILQDITCDLIGNGVAAILGPSSKTSSDIVQMICNMTGIPHLQFDWHVPQTPRDRLNQLMTINVAPSERMISSAIYDILRSASFEWKSFTIAHEEESRLGRLQHVLTMKQLQRVGIKMQSFKRGSDYRILWKRIKDTRESYVLLDCPPDILVDVINASIAFNMTGSFNNLFLTNLDTHTSDIDRFYSPTFTVAIAAIRIRSYIPPSVQDETDIFEHPADQFIALNTQLIFDAIILFYNALLKLIEHPGFYIPECNCGRGYWQLGRELVQLMKELSPKAVKPPYRTQRLKLTEHGEREDFNLMVYNPIIDRVSHFWNMDSKLVDYETVKMNSTQAQKLQRRKQKEDFSQQRARYTVATRVGEPYFSWKPELNGEHYEGNERFHGYAVDLMFALGKECKFDFDFEPVKDNKYGSYDADTDEWDGIIRQIMDNNAQIGICDLTITQARRRVVDFTVPFMKLGIGILALKQPPEVPSKFAFLTPYCVDVWLYVMVAMLITAMVLIFVSRMDPYEWEEPVMNEDNELERENSWQLQNTMWLVVGSILNQGCDLLPRGFSMRLLVAFWWIFALLISQTYIAQLAAFITTSKMNGGIGSLHDLVEQNLVTFGTIRGGATSIYFSESNETVNRIAWNKMFNTKGAFTISNEEGVKRVKKSQGKYAFLMETTNLEFHMNKPNSDLTQIGESFGEKHYGIAVPINAKFRSILNVGILRLSERGELYKMRKHWFVSNTTSENETSENKNNQYNMDTMIGLFLVLIAGVLLSFLIGVAEFLWNAHCIALRERISRMKALKAEFRFLIRVWLRRKPTIIYQESRDSTCTGYSSMGHTSITSSLKKRQKSKRRSK